MCHVSGRDGGYWQEALWSNRDYNSCLCLWLPGVYSTAEWQTNVTSLRDINNQINELHRILEQSERAMRKHNIDESSFKLLFEHMTNRSWLHGIHHSATKTEVLSPFKHIRDYTTLNRSLKMYALYIVKCRVNVTISYLSIYHHVAVALSSISQL